jgi:hypothetical protein
LSVLVTDWSHQRCTGCLDQVFSNFQVLPAENFNLRGELGFQRNRFSPIKMCTENK